MGGSIAPNKCATSCAQHPEHRAVLLALQKLEMAVSAGGRFILEPGDAHDKRARLLPNPDTLIQERRDVEKMARDVRDQVR